MGFEKFLNVISGGKGTVIDEDEIVSMLAKVVAAILRSSLAEELELAKSQFELYTRVFENPEEYPEDYELIVKEDLNKEYLSEKERKIIIAFLRQVTEELY